MPNRHQIQIQPPPALGAPGQLTVENTCELLIHADRTKRQKCKLPHLGLAGVERGSLCLVLMTAPGTFSGGSSVLRGFLRPLWKSGKFCCCSPHKRARWGEDLVTL